MKIWIITIYEPLPFDDEKTRPQRCGMLARALLDRGHKVEIWTSVFDHATHRRLYKASVFESIDERISIQFIKGRGYPRDRSLKRFFHNRETAEEFTRLANDRHSPPDIIFAPIPILELAQVATSYACKRNIPVIVDVRDIWPDIYLTMFPKVLEPIIKALLTLEFRRAEYIFKNATGITAVSKAYLQKGLSYAKREHRSADGVFPLGSVKPVNYGASEFSLEEVALLERFGISQSNQFLATYVGTFSSFCDIKNIIDAAKLLIDYNDIRIVIIGTGDRSKEFTDQGSMLPNVTMTGWLNATAIQAILRQTNVGLVAYSKDATMSLPNKPFEYMAEGLPLLSSLRGELEELIQRHGIGRSYEAGNPRSLADGIRWFYGHPEEARQMGKRSFALFSTNFRSDIVYKDFSEHLEWIARRYGGKQANRVRP